MNLPKTWRNIAGSIVAPGIVVATGMVAQASSSARPRAADAPVAPPPEKDPKAPQDPKAESPLKCAKCDTGVPTMEPPAKFCPGCAAPLDGSAPPPAEGEPAKALALGRHTFTMTGAASHQAARGVLAAWKESHATHGPLSSALATANGRLDVLERERVLERAVAEHKLDPSEAWSFSEESGKKVRSFSPWAGPPQADGTGQTLEQLVAFIERRSQASGSGPARSSKALTPAAPPAPPASPPPRGIKSDIYAAAKRQVAALTGGGET